EFFRDFFPEQYYRQQIKSLGTGMIITEDGYILTNEHVVSNATDIHVSLPDGRNFSAELVAADRTIDLALLKIEGEEFPHVVMGNSDDIMIGEWVIALGNPFGFLLEDTSPTVTVGVVSALYRSIKSTRDERVYKNMIQTDAAINPGNSGGPLVNILGQVIGINTFIFTSSGGSEGIGFARPVSIAKKFIDEAKEFGRVRSPWIGLWLQDITPELAKTLNIEPIGILVTNIDEKSPASGAGIKVGDRLTRANGSMIRRVADWERLVAGVFVGDTLHIAYTRLTKQMETSFIVTEYVESEGTRLQFGIFVENINYYLAKKYNLPYESGVVVTKVETNSVGKHCGLLPGDVVLAVGNKRISQKQQFQDALKEVRKTYLIIDRGGLILQMYFSI
ncbi:trypsin-like peptidase domain-containing protein, partial [candidate division WOR-3 bacterium]|nr:trypsin-like peptidase domain-containing protein [candidate division WOR-3 bacterium]